MIGAVRGYREARPVMRAHVGLPVVDTNAMDRTRRVRIEKRHDGMVSRRTAEHVSECDRRPAGRYEYNREAATFTCVVLRDARVGNAAAVIIRPGEGERGAD